MILEALVKTAPLPYNASDGPTTISMDRSDIEFVPFSESPQKRDDGGEGDVGTQLARVCGEHEQQSR